MPEYKGPKRYNENDFIGYAKHDVLDGEVEAFLDNMDAAGIDYQRVLHAFEYAI